MDSLPPTLPNSSPPGSKDTAKEQKEQDVTATTAKHITLSESPTREFYQRQGIVLPPIVDPPENLSLINRVKHQLVPQTEIDVKTALAEGYQVAFELQSGRPSIIVGYNATEKVFTIVVDDDGVFQVVAFDRVLNPFICEFWTLHI